MAASAPQIFERSRLLHQQPSVPWPERALAAVALAIAAPVLAGICVAVRVLSGRSPLISHPRLGQFCEPLEVLKIRTMWGPDTSSSTAQWIERLVNPHVPAAKCNRDPRVTSRFAALLRRYSIDELPQLFHIACGRMRFVGPRPLTRSEVDTHYGPVAAEIFSVPPGLTGLWQVKGRDKLSYAQRRRLDLFFVRKSGFGLTLRILLATPWRVLSGRDTV